MTIRETIAKLHAINIKARLNKLTDIGAPEVIITELKKHLADLENGKIKVNGMERKHKVGDYKVLEAYQEKATGHYYIQGKKSTIVLKLITEQGTFYYDYVGNKLGASEVELDVTIQDKAFEPIKF